MRPMYPGMKARTSDGGVATVTDILIDRRSHELRYLVLSANGYFGPDVLAPSSAVWRVDEAVHLALTSGDVATLPRFDHYEHCRSGDLCSRSAWRYGANRQGGWPAPRPLTR